MTDRSSPASLARRRFALSAAACAACAAVPAFAQSGSKRLRIGFQKGGGLLGLLKAQGKVEPAFAAQDWSVSWHEFPAGPQLLEALDAGSVDFGYTGAPPPIFAQSAGKDLVYVGAEPGSDAIEAIVVKPGSPLRAVADLRGRRVAVHRGSSAHYLLLAALAKAGIGLADIQPVYLPPADARAAFESDRVDAWVIWDPYLAAVQSALQVRVLADYTGLVRPNSFYEASRDFASRAPRQLGALLELLATTGAWAVAHPADVARQLAPGLGLPPEIVEVWQRRTRYGVRPVDAAVVTVQQSVADLFAAQRLIPAKVDVAAAVWRWQRD